MPFTSKDATKHTKKANTDDQKKRWAAVANSALEKCLEDGGEQAECEASAITQASGVLAKENDEMEEVTKTIDGKARPASDFLVVEDSEKPSTWHLPVKVNGEVDRRLMGAAWAALHDGYRGNKYEGPDKATAISKLKALYKSEDMETPAEEAAALDIGTLREYLEKALAMLEEHELVESEAEFAESAVGHVISLAEAVPADTIVPLHLDVALITPGWGNKRDNHYYPREVVERDAGVFAGVKMFETDHRQDEKSTRTWVSTVKEIAGFTDDGAPIAKVSVHDKNFAERLIALHKDNLLEKMECSILAAGMARKGKIDGKKAHIVESITNADSVDWVTRAGAGGRALGLSESENGGTMDDKEKETDLEEAEEVTISEQEEPETPAPVKLAEDEVSKALDGTNLPDASKKRLVESDYLTKAELDAAIVAEIAYVKEVTGSGKVFGQGGSTPVELTPEEIAERADKRYERIMNEVGMGV